MNDILLELKDLIAEIKLNNRRLEMEINGGIPIMKIIRCDGKKKKSRFNLRSLNKHLLK